MKLDLVDFETTDNITLPGLLFEPEKKTNEVIISLHGNGSASIFYSQERVKILANEFTDNNIAFFPFNNRGAHIAKRLTRNKGKENEEDLILGTAYEKIKDCVHDIDGAIEFLRSKGYNTFHLLGHSTGANKIVVYDYYKKNNPIATYTLWAGGDDTGLYHSELGDKTFKLALDKAKQKIEQGRGMDLVPKYILPEIYSYQALFDILNPDGDYNTFPFKEYLTGKRLGTKKLFKEYKQINKPTLVMYGEQDEYCYPDAKTCVDALKKHTRDKGKFIFKLVPGADHSFHGKEGELAREVTAFIRLHPTAF